MCLQNGHKAHQAGNGDVGDAWNGGSWAISGAVSGADPGNVQSQSEVDLGQVRGETGRIVASE